MQNEVNDGAGKSDITKTNKSFLDLLKTHKQEYVVTNNVIHWLSDYLVTEKSARKNNHGFICSSCGQSIGDYHRIDCEHICKNITIRGTVDFIFKLPAMCGDDVIEHYFSSIWSSLYNFSKIVSRTIEHGEPYLNSDKSGDDSVYCYLCSEIIGYKRNGDCFCKDVKIRSVVEYTITVPSTWGNLAIAEYTENEEYGACFKNFKFEKIIDESNVYLDEYSKIHMFEKQ